MLKETASQTAGPYLHIGLMPRAIGLDLRREEPGNVLAGPGVRGERVRLEGTVYDGEGAPVRDALIEIWQANADGRYDHPGDTQDKPLDPAFHGFGRAVADFKTGLWWFDTVKPGVVTGRHGRPMAPHINVAVFARGITIHLNTRIYFADEEEANAEDPVLAALDDAQRATLLARPTDGGYRLDVRLQGEGETVFFAI